MIFVFLVLLLSETIGQRCDKVGEETICETSVEEILPYFPSATKGEEILIRGMYSKITCAKVYRFALVRLELDTLIKSRDVSCELEECVARLDPPCSSSHRSSAFSNSQMTQVFFLQK